MKRNKPKKRVVVSAGEILMRLSTHVGEISETASNLSVSYGGSEGNVAINLASLSDDIESKFFTVLPDDSWGFTAKSKLLAHNVHPECIIVPNSRLGKYLVETGVGPRASKVTYDRKNSAFADFDYSKVDYDDLLEGCDWLHLSGITPALSNSCLEFTLNMLKTAKKKNITVSFDGNYRAGLWNNIQEARDTFTPFLPYINVMIGIEPYNIIGTDGMDVKYPFDEIPDKARQAYIFNCIADQYPNIKVIIRHNRVTHSSTSYELSAYLWYDWRTYSIPPIPFEVVDRVGGGDALTSGVIYSLLNNMEPMDILYFSLASSILQGTIKKDYSIFTAEEVQAYANQLKLGQKVSDVKR